MSYTELELFTISKEDTKDFRQLVIDKSKSHGAIYRGIMLNKNLLYKNATYQHWNNLVSWSKDITIAEKFANMNEVPEGLYYTAFQLEHGYIDYSMNFFDLEDKYNDTFVKVVLVDKESHGYYINEDHPKHDFNYEEEVIVPNHKYKFDEIEFVSDKGYYKVYVSVEDTKKIS